MAAKVTLKTLARELGVSHMTVSRAINNHPNVNADLREKVQQLALELGYIQSATAKALRGLKSGTIGLLLPNIINDFYAQFAQAFGDLCTASRCNLVIHLTGEDAERERQALNQLRGLNADAAILVSTLDEQSRYIAEKEEAMSLVYLIRQPRASKQIAFVGIDDSKAIMNAVEYLADKGAREIAFIGPITALSSGRSRAEAFRKGLEATALRVCESLILPGPPSYAHGREAVEKLLAQDHALDGIICGGVEISRGALEQLLFSGSQGRSLPDFVGYGNPAIHRWLNGGIPSIELPIAMLARSAFDLALASDDQVGVDIRYEAWLTNTPSDDPIGSMV